MSNPFFSVIVPAYNSAQFIWRGLGSIKTQDFKDYELIVVCDSCTDSTATVAANYADQLIVTDFHSAGGARNAGMDIAKGEWILFMDDDDWYLPGAFEAIAEELKRQKDIDILAYGFQWKGMGEARQSQKRIYPAIWNKAWRRSFIGETRFPVWMHTDDVGFNRQLFGSARFGFLDKTLYYYNFMREGSVSDRIRKGEYDNSELPGEYRQIAEGYERWLKGKEFKK